MIRALLITLTLSACSASNQKTSLTVFAASSLTESFTALAAAFERAHPQVHVTLSLGGSQTLRLQIEHGAPADVFASANPEHLRAAVAAGDVTESRCFAHNRLVLITPPHNPAHIERFEQLGRAQRVVLGSPEVPAGRYARAVLAKAPPELRAMVLKRVVSEEPNVRLVAAKVQLGEADAALVYRTDAVAAGAKLHTIAIPERFAVRAKYLQGRVTGRPNPELAQRWLEFVSGPAGQRILAQHGFEAP